MREQSGDITNLLERWNRGDREAFSLLIDMVYGDLRKVAAGRLGSRGRLNRSLCTTELVHETYLALQRQDRTTWQNRTHFFAVAARLVRRIVAERHRQGSLQKHGAGAPRLSIEGNDLKIPCNYPNWLVLDQALDRLETVDHAAYQVVLLRYVLGLSLDEAAKVLKLGTATVGRHWRFARAWLRAQLERMDLHERPNLA